jgi:hypothetical protein
VSRVDPANPPVNRKVENPPGRFSAYWVVAKPAPEADVGDTEDLESIPAGDRTEPQARDDETEANARLIAAAPELLAAAKDALAKMNVLLALAGDEDPHWRALWAAVRKAEGSQPPPAPEAKREPSPLPPDFTDNDHDGMG